ncbi:MAG: transposase [Sedimentisphaerales bacterium]|nr:transposase [Sedimentisphaerales bacterium]
MAKTVGYMITWTTYGTWLQGERKGFVKDGEVRGENIAIKKDCEKKLEHKQVRLGNREKKIVKEAIIEAAKRFKQRILAMAVYSNHIHIVCEYVDIPIEVIAGYYKNAGRVALQNSGFKGKVWTAGYDRRFCFSENELKARIEYVNRHGNK